MKERMKEIGEKELQILFEKQELGNDNGGMYKIKVEKADGEIGELLVSPEHKVYVKEEKNKGGLVSIIMMNKSIKDNSVFFDFEHQNKMPDMNSFEITKVMPEVFEMLNCRFIQRCYLVNFILESLEQSNIFSFELLQDILNLRGVDFHIESHNLLNSLKLMGFFLPDFNSLAVCPMDSTTSLATDSLTSLSSSSEISEISRIFFFNSNSSISRNLSTNACLATDDQLIQSVLSISDFNSSGTDSVIVPIFDLQSNYLYYLYTKDISKPFGQKDLSFKFRAITEIDIYHNYGAEIDIYHNYGAEKFEKKVTNFSGSKGDEFFIENDEKFGKIKEK